MLTPSPKAFDYHNFLSDVLRQSDSREYFLAEHTDLAKGMVNVPYRNYFYGIGLATGGCVWRFLLTGNFREIYTFA